jgi:hypothetical protein
MNQIKTIYCLSFALLCSSFLFAQTKLIAHKSHSGSDYTFKLAYEGGFFDMENSNLGMAPERTVRSASLDSLILISDSVAVMVTSEYCNRQNSRKPNATTKWRAGRDTVYNHPLFSKKYSIDYIRSTIKQQYYFQNPVDSVKFIVIDDEQQDQQQYQSLPIAGDNNDNGPGSNQPFMWICLIAIFSLFAGTAYHFVSRFQKLA